MPRYLILILLPLLAACAAPDGDGPFPGLFPSQEPEAPPAPPPLPAAVQAALPPGVPASIVIQNTDGCYIYSVERTDPPSGYPVRDAAGNPICEGGPALVAPPVIRTAALAPVTSSPLDPDAASMATPLRGVGVEPLVDPASDVEPAADIEPAAVLPPIGGSITPPAPLAPLNG